MEDKNNNNSVISLTDPEGSVQRIDMSTLKPMNDPNCTHEWTNDDEVIGNMRAQTCLHCPLGRWIPKSEVSPGS